MQKGKFFRVTVIWNWDSVEEEEAITTLTYFSHLSGNTRTWKAFQKGINMNYKFKKKEEK